MPAGFLFTLNKTCVCILANHIEGRQCKFYCCETVAKEYKTVLSTKLNNFVLKKSSFKDFVLFLIFLNIKSQPHFCIKYVFFMGLSQIVHVHKGCMGTIAE